MTEIKQNKHILIVDDDEINTSILAKLLNKKGYQTSVLHSGVGLIQQVEKINPDLILLDIMMPEISGTDALVQLRELYQKNDLPVIMVTSKENPKDIVQALKLGANDYITKPANIEIVEARISTQLEIVSLTKEYAKQKGLEAISALVITYNHEIKNPLTIAIGTSERIKKDISQEKFDILNQALWRMSDIVTKISKAAENTDIHFENYGNKDKMLKI